MLRLALLEIALCNVYNAPRIVQSKEDILRTTSEAKTFSNQMSGSSKFTQLG